MTHPPSGPTNQHVGDYDYTYDANKNKTSEVITGQLSGYGFNSSGSPASYDDEDRLTSWNRTDGNKDQSWSLSLVGDWNSFTDESTTQNRTHNDVHELTAIGAQSLVYDVKGNLTTNSNGQKYTYDFDNRMSEIDVDGNGTADLKFRYDALGRRVMYWNGTKWYDYVVAGQQLLMVYQTNGTAQHKFIYGSYVDEPVMIVRTLNTTPTKYFYHRNQQYSVVALTDASTGLTKERYAYDAYGDTIILNYLGTSVKSQSDYSNPFMYTGRFTHPTTGLYYFRARWYDPELGRFVSRDPIGYVDGTNLYRGYFCPNGVDPTGATFVIANDRDKIYKKTKTALENLCDDCPEASREGCSKACCKREADAIAWAIYKTWVANDRRSVGGIIGDILDGQQKKGIWCYEWAYGWEDAFHIVTFGDEFDPGNPNKDRNKSKCFKAKVGWCHTCHRHYNFSLGRIEFNESYKVHAWLEITGICAEKVIYVDDGFSGHGGHVFDFPPVPGGYSENGIAGCPHHELEKRSKCKPATPDYD